jgi:hypothetical protein
MDNTIELQKHLMKCWLGIHTKTVELWLPATHARTGPNSPAIDYRFRTVSNHEHLRLQISSRNLKPS